MHLHIVNGPNLNLLGKREVDIYGKESFEDYLKLLQAKFSNLKLTYFQSNIEGELINSIQENGFICDGIIINPAGYSHTSVAIADAIAAVPCKTVEVHISNIHAREEFRKHSFVSSKAKGVICGLGLFGYEAAILSFLEGKSS
ncbi:MAG: type II 3-dehydroquinate dehydratase [Chitinophagaceae bacterium]|jgi:3-dehydroquinate dehydratase II